MCSCQYHDCSDYMRCYLVIKCPPLCSFPLTSILIHQYCFLALLFYNMYYSLFLHCLFWPSTVTGINVYY
ncbi:hypothetical protein BDF19DRAFT_447166, partial [Syncephalis fuscata]